MHAGTIFVLFLAAGFLALVFYLHHLSQRTADREPQPQKAPEQPPLERSNEVRPRKRAS